MDFLDPKKRKAHRIKLYIGYGLIAVALAFATTVVLYQAYGYDYDPKTGEIVQNGLVFIDASPVDANITLNGVSRGRTDTRIDTVAGDYTLELQENGYRTWKHDFTLEGGKIERLVYPFLFPTQLNTTDIQLYASNPGFLSQSPNRRWLLAAQPGSFQNFDLIDTNADIPTAQNISLPSGLLKTTGATHTLKLIEWSSDNRHALIRHNFDGGQEYLVLDIESPESSVNVTSSIPEAAKTVMLRDKKFDQYYLFDAAAKTLNTADLRTRTPEAYLKDVLAFQPHGNDIMAYVSSADAEEGKAWIKVREGSDVYNLRQITLSENYLVDIARFENSWYVTAGSTKDQHVFIFKNPVAAIKRDSKHLPVPVAVLRSLGQPEFLSYSANARFVLLQNSKEFSVYDAETDRQYRYDTGLEVEAGNEALWMDGHRLSVVSKERVMVFDFDGTNMQDLTPAVKGSQVYFNQGWEDMFTIAPSVSVTGRTAITSTALRANP